MLVEEGGRQGCRFGGKIFNTSYAVALYEFRDQLREYGVETRMHRNNGMSIWQGPSDVKNDTVPVVDVTFVDDEAIVIMASVPATLNKYVDLALKMLIQTFEKYNILINWKRGKTEAMFAYRGKKAKAFKDRLHTENGQFYNIPMDTGAGKLVVVSQYKHLGGIIDISGSLVPEARRRVRSAMTSFAPLSIKMVEHVHWKPTKYFERHVHESVAKDC